MTTLRFIPIFEDEVFLAACTEYTTIWETDGPAILQAFIDITGRALQEDRIAALVYEGMSFSGRSQNDIMRLRASYNFDVKKGTLIHELGHRLFFDVTLGSSEQEHLFLNLFLYDVWERLYGKAYADTLVAVESGRSEMYRRAWEQALTLSFPERQARLKEILTSFKATQPQHRST